MGVALNTSLAMPQLRQLLCFFSICPHQPVLDEQTRNLLSSFVGRHCMTSSHRDGHACGVVDLDRQDLLSVYDLAATWAAQ